MSANNLLLPLIRSHFEGDNQRFVELVENIAHEHEYAGRKILAKDIRDMLGKGRGKPVQVSLPDAIRKFVDAEMPVGGLDGLVLDKGVEGALRRMLRIYERRAALVARGLPAARKLLMTGPSGTGKTSTASALAAELGLPLFCVRLDGLVRSYMGETANNLRAVFDAMKTYRGVWFFDEFDALGADRSTGQDVGEARRVLNSLLTMIEKDASDGLLLAATNLPEMLDLAVFRRFDRVIAYPMPSNEDVRRIVENRLPDFDLSGIDWSGIIQTSQGFAHADIEMVAIDAAIDVVIEDRPNLRGEDLARAAIGHRERRRGRSVETLGPPVTDR